MRRISSLILLAGLAWAQQTANVIGTVTNSVTGAPIPRVHVVFHGDKPFGAVTNEDHSRPK